MGHDRARDFFFTFLYYNNYLPNCWETSAPLRRRPLKLRLCSNFSVETDFILDIEEI